MLWMEYKFLPEPSMISHTFPCMVLDNDRLSQTCETPCRLVYKDIVIIYLKHVIILTATNWMISIDLRTG